ETHGVKAKPASKSRKRRQYPTGWIEGACVSAFDAELSQDIQIHGLQRRDHEVGGAVKVRFLVCVRDCNRPQTRSAGGFESPPRILDRDARGRGDPGAGGALQKRERALVRIGGGLADRRVLGGDDGAEVRGQALTVG